MARVLQLPQRPSRHFGFSCVKGKTKWVMLGALCRRKSLGTGTPLCRCWARAVAHLQSCATTNVHQLTPRRLQDTQSLRNLTGELIIMSFCSCLASRIRAVSSLGSLGRVGYANETGSRRVRWRGLASIATDKQQKVRTQHPSILAVIARNANA